MSADTSSPARDAGPPMLKAERLSMRYGRRAALTDCDLDIPQGRVVGLVGPNGAGKSTLLQLACGLITPTAGRLAVFGARPAASAAHLARVGFVAQDTPVYPSLSVGDHLRMGAHLNPRWDAGLANRRIAQAGLNPRQRAGRLSGGQRAQLALTVAAAKRPDLLILDEPAAALDPLARSGFLRNLVDFVVELGAGAVLSSHLLGDIERVCDYLVVLCGSRVQIAGDVRDLLATHHRVVTARGEHLRLPAGAEPIWNLGTDRRPAWVVRSAAPPAVAPGAVERVELEDLVLAYMTRAAGVTAAGVTVPAGRVPR